MHTWYSVSGVDRVLLVLGRSVESRKSVTPAVVLGSGDRVSLRGA